MQFFQRAHITKVCLELRVVHDAVPARYVILVEAALATLPHSFLLGHRRRELVLVEHAVDDGLLRQVSKLLFDFFLPHTLFLVFELAHDFVLDFVPHEHLTLPLVLRVSLVLYLGLLVKEHLQLHLLEVPTGFRFADLCAELFLLHAGVRHDRAKFELIKRTDWVHYASGLRVDDVDLNFVVRLSILSVLMKACLELLDSDGVLGIFFLLQPCQLGRCFSAHD